MDLSCADKLPSINQKKLIVFDICENGAYGFAKMN